MSDDHFLNLQPGTIIAGRYEVVKCLGTGSMGMVYACRHRELGGHLVAMKVLFSEVARDTVAAARFRNEIVASYGVSHPNVVRAFEYFRDGDLVAFTMEYIGGGDLADRITHDELLSIDEISRMLTQMCSGVQAIHEAGIIHRDLKPENILITTDGDIKITDFGIARTVTGPKLTEHGGVVGTIDYVSPEYLERGQVDARSDIYALGVLAFEMITGESPFKGNSVIETMTIRLRTDPPPPSSLRPECPPGLDRIVLRAMARDPKKRYQKASEMCDDLKSLRSGQPLAESSELGAPETHAQVSPDRATIDASEPLTGFTGLAGASSGGGLSAYTPNISIYSDHNAVSKNKVRYEEEVEHLESVLSAKSVGRVGSENDEVHVPKVSVSQGHISADRMKQLSLDLQPRHRGRKRKLLRLAGVVLTLVLLIGLLAYALRYFQPGSQ